MVTLFTDPRMLEHRPPARHPERPERLSAILRQLERTGLMQASPRGTLLHRELLALGQLALRHENTQGSLF